jgi:hypothetical protein
MKPGDMHLSSRNALAEATREMAGELTAVVAFHCPGRYLEGRAAGSMTRAGALRAGHQISGCSTAGEQFDTLHMTHNLTVVVFGRRTDGRPAD